MNKAYTVLTSTIAGALVTLSLEPFGWWPLAIVAAALLYHFIQHTSIQQAWLVSLSFSFGLFLSGASWVYVSIHEFGYTTPALAAVLTFLFCLLNAAVNATVWCTYSFFQSAKKRSGWISPLLFACVGLLSEQVRSWIFTGFPWLLVGYSQTESLLAGWAPITGVYGISFIIYLSGAALARWFATSQLITSQLTRSKDLSIQPEIADQDSNKHSTYTAPFFSLPVIILFLWLAGPALKMIEWTNKYGDPVSVSLIQANISQHEKWDPEMLMPTLRLYSEMSEPEWKRSDLVIWPEAAVPREFHRIKPYLDSLSDRAAQSNTTFITGIPYRDQTPESSIYNSVLSLGTGDGIYHKRHLVPFGEYIPMEKYISRLLSVFELPLSHMRPGPVEQDALTIDSWSSQPLICYEVVYPFLTAEAARKSDALITVSNDSWFGASIGPLQHMQMAQMRAIENGRYMLRSTGNGVSVIVNHKGEIVARSEQFRREVLHGEFYLTQGKTPWTSWGYRLIGWLAPVALLGLWLSGKSNRQIS